ncbi:MAG TPA: Holliday junction branch migration protein RuvA [Myxococcota bacterium]
MIAWLEGTLRERTPTRVVVDVSGVGYELQIPLSTFAVLPDAGKVIALHVHTHAREGALQLFGFATPLERSAFELLLRASRVGPKLAQTVLSGIGPVELLQAIRDGDVAPLRAVPGVGPKVAARILVELRDRADELAAAVADSGEALPRAAPPSPDSAREQALSALLNLGYSKGLAERVLGEVEGALGPDAAIEAYVRAALKGLSR